MNKSTATAQAMGVRRVAIPQSQGPRAASVTPPAVDGKRKVVPQLASGDPATKRVCRPDSATSSDDLALDMRLAMNSDSHKCVIKMIVKTKLFPFVKFITEGATDMQFGEKAGICGFLLTHCYVGGNPRMWWQTYERVVRRMLNDHRNNKIKCIQNAYCGTFTSCLICHNPVPRSHTCVLVAMQNNVRGPDSISSCVQDLRRDVESYKLLWLAFGPAVLGSTEWNDQAATGAMSTMLTVSDEAFLLVVLENYGDRWDAMLDRVNRGYTMVSATYHNGSMRY
jgi:hypothetical protein